MDVTFQLVKAEDITSTQKAIVATLLEQQGKVRAPYQNKAERCRIVCFALENGEPFAMGAIKKKTARVFLPDKANQPDLADMVDEELGYIYNSRIEVKGVGKKIVSRLLEPQSV